MIDVDPGNPPCSCCRPCLQESNPSGPHMPVGLQIVGRAFDEASLLQLAHAYELSRAGALNMQPPMLKARQQVGAAQ